MMLHALLLSILPFLAGASERYCRCRPSEACWPTDSQWAALNTSIDGNLHAVRPIGAACHGETFDTSTCDAVTANSNNSLWRSGQPGAVQWQNWEARPAKEESCFIGSSAEIPCGQGRVSLFSAAVQKAEHIQAAVRFAQKHEVRLAIKNTGHCYLGRSSAPESLQIATHALQSIEFVDNFFPTRCGKKAKSSGSAVTIGAGVQLKPLYTAVAERNLTVVAGLSHTVGAAGGYVQGGGHSPLGTWKGLAADNVLQFEVVTAEGKLLVANEYQHTDLFWALRGGGGGSFGVVVSVTLRTFAEVPACLSSVTVNTANATAFWDVIQSLHVHLPELNDEGGAGYYFITPSRAAASASSLIVGLIFANQTDQARIDVLHAPMVAEMAKTVGNASVSYTSFFMPQTKYYFEASLPDAADTGGVFVATGSRLISRDFLMAPEGPARLTDVLKTIAADGRGGGMTGHVVAGGQVARNAVVDSAVNPAWRRTLTHVVFGQGWDANTTWAEQKAIEERITNKHVPLLKALEPDMGAYPNEADGNEADFQASFWGNKYEKLYKIKKKWDPRGLFITRRGVGSEEWDEDGLCRVH